MDRFMLSGFMAIICTPTSIVLADPRKDDSNVHQIIPLNEIWGYNLPGTKDIAGISFPSEREGIGQTYAYLTQERSTNIELIRRALASKPASEPAMAGFVLPRGPDSLTLRGIHSQLHRKPGPIKPDLQEGEYTLVFFSHPLSYYTRLRKVERVGNDISIHYQFEPHMTPETTAHFALIPLGPLSAARYRVIYKQIPIEQKYRNAGFEPVHPEASEIVCRDFSFAIGTPLKNEPLNKDAAFIPLHEIWAYEMPGTRNVTLLDTENADGTSHPLINALHRTIADKFKKEAGRAFVIEGTDRIALENMLGAFDREPPRSVPPNTDISLVFYTRFGGHYTHLETVERLGNKFVLTYRFVTHSTFNSTFHFALIPLGKLQTGAYQVEIKQSPSIDSTGRRVTLDKDVGSVVCRGTTFYVKEKEP